MNWEYPKVEEGKLTKWNWMVQHKENLWLEKWVDIGAFCYLNAKYGIVIEKGVEIGSHCSIYSESTIDNKKGGVWLKRFCKIGTHSTIMPGVIVGKNAIVGAHSFVNCDIPANEVWGGVPATKIK